jgi:hypothetical protein
MDACREHLVGLVAEALLAHPGFRPRRRGWADHQQEDQMAARTCATAIVDHLQRCGIGWTVQQPAPPHSAGE